MVRIVRDFEWKQVYEKWVLKVKPQIINEVRSDNFWTGKISKNMLTDETIEFIKSHEY